MTVIFLRTLIIFITLVIIMRLMGKRQIGEMQPYEFIVTLIIADLACVPMSDVSIPLIYGIVSIITLFILHQIMSLIERLGGSGKLIVSGKPSIVINKNGVNIKELKKNNMDIDDLLENMRSKGFFSLDDVFYAIFETNGKLSVLENTQKQKGQTNPLLIISSGKLNIKNAQKLQVDKLQIDNFLSSQNTKLKSVEVLTLDKDGKAYLQLKNKPYSILSFKGQTI